ncbi:hypothetical protein Tco_0791093 [Tanacetum coccineum]
MSSPVAPPSTDYIPGLEDPQTPLVPQDEDEHEPMFVQAYDPDYVPEPIYPEYIPSEDEHEFPAKEGDDGDNNDADSSGDDANDEDEDDEDEEEEDEHLALTDSAVVVPADEPVSLHEGTELVIPPPSTDITIGARITVRPQASISLPPEAEVERLLAMTTPSPSPPISLSPPSAGERLARCSHTLPAHSHSPPPMPSLLTTILWVSNPIPNTQDSISLRPLLMNYKIGESSTCLGPYIEGRGVDYGFVSTIDVEAKRQGISELGMVLGILRYMRLAFKDEEAADVDVHLYRSMIGLLKYLTSSRPDIMFAICAYARDSPFDLDAFFDSDYAGASLDRKSIIGGCQFLRKRLISWQCKKQTIVANSTTEAEYVATANCCRQNLVFHSRIKHIEIRPHFIMDSYEKRLIQVIKIHTDHDVADLLTKAFVVSRFQYLIARYLEWNGTTAKDEFKVSVVRVTYYWQVYLMLIVAFNTIVKIKDVEPIKQKWVKDETIIKEWEDRMERDATTAFSLEAEWDSVLVYAGRHSLTAARNKLMLPGITYYRWAKTVNGEHQIQALVDKKKVIITEKSVRSDFMLEDAEGIECLPNDKKSKKKQRKDSGSTERIPDEATNEERISTPSYDLPQSGKDRLQLTKLMNLCTKLLKQVRDLEEVKTAQAKEVASLKKRVKQLEKRKKSRTSGLKRLRKGRKIVDLDADAEVTLIDETQERYDEEMLFYVQDDLQGEEVVAKKEVAEKEVSATDLFTIAGEVVTTVSATTTIDELTLAQTLMAIKAAKPKAITTSATTITTALASTRPKEKGIVFHDQEEQASAFTPIVSSS